MLAHKRFFILGLLVTGMAVVFDQLSKWLIVEKIILPGHNVIEMAPFFNIVLVRNFGVSFGLFADHRQPLLLTAVSIAIVSILLTWLYKNTSKLGAWALGSVMGGAIGNIIDRVRYGSVVDFLDFHLGPYHWPAFNIADSCIFIGVVLLCGSSMFTPRTNQPEGLK